MKNIMIGVFCLTFFASFIIWSGKGSAQETDRDIAKMLNKIKGENLRETITHLTSYGNRSEFQKQWDASLWIQQQFQKYGIETELHTYEYQNNKWPNVIAKINGTDDNSGKILLIAHIDSISYDSQNRAPGADDNGSGTAVLLESARLLREQVFKRPIWFCIFTNEERGRAGSKYFARMAKDKKENIHAVVNLDVLGYNRPAWPLEWNAIGKHERFKNKIKAIYLMVKNYLTGFAEGRDILLVAGKPDNRELGNRIAEKIRETKFLKVKELFSDDCG
jgi:Zn-dependent M28 family amino/carboxypeptidase